MLLMPFSSTWAQTIRVGIMLPLHDENGDGRRMVEYYRGFLMGCDSLKTTGLKIDVHAWNVPENGNIQDALRDPSAAQCDLIVGPLYSKQVKPLSAFVTKHDIKLLIPFSINTQELYSNGNLFQVYQSGNAFNESVIGRFVQTFRGYHPVIIDCKDSTSTKGPFMSAFRRHLEASGIQHHITNIRSTDEVFSKAFSRTQPNVVVLNSSRSPELGVVFKKLNALKAANPDVDVTVFGYTEWLMYTNHQLDNFYKFNVYIPSPYFYNPLTSKAVRLQQKYRWNFHEDMMQSLPRFAATGFDHAMYFLSGLRRYGKRFIGERGSVVYSPIQTPLTFERLGNGGLQNRALLFVHYMPDHRVETIHF